MPNPGLWASCIELFTRTAKCITNLSMNFFNQTLRIKAVHSNSYVMVFNAQVTSFLRQAWFTPWVSIVPDKRDWVTVLYSNLWNYFDNHLTWWIVNFLCPVRVVTLKSNDLIWAWPPPEEILLNFPWTMLIMHLSSFSNLKSCLQESRLRKCCLYPIIHEIFVCFIYHM